MARKRSFQHKLETITSINNISAIDADTIGFVPRILINTSFPAKNIQSNEYERVNGKFTLHIHSPFGVPYGSVARRAMYYIAKQVVTQKSPEIFLGKSQAKFLFNLKMQSTGGVNGTIVNLQNQIKRLFTSTISWSETTDVMFSCNTMSITKEVCIFWDKRTPEQWQTHLTLSEEFYQEIINNAVPIDLRVIDALSYYPFAMDVYGWLTYRYFHLKSIQRIPWLSLEGQFGNNYSRLINFKRKFNKAITEVSFFYPQANYKITEDFLILYKSSPHIPPKLVKTFFDTS